MKFKVIRPKYNDEFEYIIAEDKNAKCYKLVNLTSKTILTQKFSTSDEAIEFLKNVNGWEVFVIKE